MTRDRNQRVRIDNDTNLCRKSPERLKHRAISCPRFTRINDGDFSILSHEENESRTSSEQVEERDGAGRSLSDAGRSFMFA